ncbi:hypothetical protein [Phytomonospora endophytica]|uniref:Uncharacterized protein n=1 Tax=Phytomonospora endophytica TaxID=714109 RepID=A0A841FL90_9ACTN|nr:hypothetical protein [Phytomonospora endophytica]MBB6034568.1 hypothetical protein [Phytomonospora endophytica]GIG71372.1 hypothetical protein Pen01_76670 [Phytomonospora endophytica]
MSDESPAAPDRSSFTPADWEAFEEAVRSTLYAYGAEEQSIDGGVELASGQPVDIHYFDLGGLADRLAGTPREEWPGVCDSEISLLVNNDPQREWMIEAGFAGAAETIEPWLQTKPHEMFIPREGYDLHPDDPYSVPFAENLHVGFTVLAPENDVTDQLRTWVSNAVVEAWGVSAEELLEAVRARLRRQDPPIWHKRELTARDRDGVKRPARALVAEARDQDEDEGTPASGWILLLDEILPPGVPDTLAVGIPLIDELFIAPEMVVAQRAYKHHLHGRHGEREPVSPLAYPLSAVLRGV